MSRVPDAFVWFGAGWSFGHLVEALTYYFCTKLPQRKAMLESKRCAVCKFPLNKHTVPCVPYRSAPYSCFYCGSIHTDPTPCACDRITPTAKNHPRSAK